MDILQLTPYDMVTLLGVVRRTELPIYFFQQLYNRQINFETQKIYFERVYENHKGLAAFVAPNVQAALNRQEGYTAEAHAPAYIKEKDTIDINMPFYRMPGETPVTGSLSNEQRRAAWIAVLTQQHMTKIHNRFEWMAARAAIDAQIVIESDRYPRAVLDFGRDAGLTLVSNWKAPGANGFADIKKQRRLSNQLCGSKITTNIFGADAWDAFYNLHKDELKDLLDTRYRGSETNITRLLDGYEGMEYVGVIQGLNGAGRMEVYINTATYIDEKGAVQYYLDQGSVFGYSPSLFNGARCFGAIKDGRAGYRAIDIFPKNWVGQEDPFDEYLMHQSAPLFVPGQPNASYLIKAL